MRRMAIRRDYFYSVDINRRHVLRDRVLLKRGGKSTLMS